MIDLEIQIETITTCNARCHFCPLIDHPERWGKLMDENLWKKIIDEVREIPQIVNIKPFGLGEPLLDKRLERLIEYSKGATKHCWIFTNGILLTKERAKSLHDSGVTNFVVSLNANDEEQWQKVMNIKGKGSFKEVLDNIAAVDSLGIPIEVRAVISGDRFDRIDGLNFLQQWGSRGYGGKGLTVTEGNWAGNNRDTRTIKPKPNECCWRATTQIYIDYRGMVTTCCFDPFGKQVFGDLNKQTIKEIYNSEQYVRFRENHYYNKADVYDICKNCTRI